MSRNANHRGRRAIGCMAILILGLVVVGCGSSGSDAANSESSTSTKPTASGSDTTASGSGQAGDEAEVRRLVPTFYKTYFRIDSTTQDPNDPKLADLLTGDALAYYQRQIRNEKAKGRIAKLTSATHLSTEVEQVTVTGDSATLTTCTGDGVEIVSATTGEVLDGENFAYRLDWTAKRGPDGTWKLASSKTVASYKDVLTCPAT